MPVLATFARRYLVAAIALPLAAKGLSVVARRVEAKRGPGTLSKGLDSASRAASRGRDRRR